jgi:hypothetical protein
MRAVTRFRSLRLRNFTMPLLLGALALRMLIPDVMPGDAMKGMTVRAALCSGVRGRSELLEIPGDAPKPHCERCLLTPPFEAPYAFATPAFLPAMQTPLLRGQVSQTSESPLPRAQSPRAPPHA